MPWLAANVATMRNRTVKFLGAIVVPLLLIGSTRSQDPVETIRIESDLVDLKVSVLGFTSDADAALLGPKDTHVLGRRRAAGHERPVPPAQAVDR